MSEAGSRKLMELEALRGVAAVIVLFHHFLLVVAPRLHGRNFPRRSDRDGADAAVRAG
jgi:peptidoglycan/LPS O-acetylase OafA/YrhL